MAFLIDQLSGGLAGRRKRTALDASTLLRRLAHGRQAGLVARGGLMAVAGGALLWGAMTGAEALLAARPAAATAAIGSVAPQAWADVVRPIPIYDLGGTEFAKLPRTYQARRHTPDGAREDVMSFGTLGDGRPFLRIALARRGDGTPGAVVTSLVDALAHVAGATGDTVTRVQPLPPTETRFGAIERADLVLWRGGTAIACRGFRGLPDGGDVLTLSGFACAASDRPLADKAVGCVVDRIGLLSAGDDRALRAVFLAAERRPGAAECGEGVLAASVAPPSAPGPFAALRRRAAWLEAGLGAPPLRGPLDATEDER